MSIKHRIRKLERVNGFKSEEERREYMKYAKKINPDIETITSPADYIKLAHKHFEPLPA